MGLIQESDVGRLLQDEKLMEQVVNGLVEDSQTMDALADEIADKVQDALGDDPQMRERLINAAIANESFKKRLVAKLIDELRVFRRRRGAVGGWVFSGERKPEQPMDRHLFNKWLAVAERTADLPKLNGGLWHPYRRKWATERKHLSLTDVAEAGGWKDTETLLTCYQQPDRESLLAVMSEPRKVSDASVGR